MNFVFNFHQKLLFKSIIRSDSDNDIYDDDVGVERWSMTLPRLRLTFS